MTRVQCKNAVAYIKPSLGAAEAPASVELSDADAPVLTDFRNGLLAAYLEHLVSERIYLRGFRRSPVSDRAHRWVADADG